MKGTSGAGGGSGSGALGAGEVEVVAPVPDFARVVVVEVDGFWDDVFDPWPAFGPAAVRFGTASLHAARIRPRQSTPDAAKTLAFLAWQARLTLGGRPRLGAERCSEALELRCTSSECGPMAAAIRPAHGKRGRIVRAPVETSPWQSAPQCHRRRSTAKGAGERPEVIFGHAYSPTTMSDSQSTPYP